MPLLTQLRITGIRIHTRTRTWATTPEAILDSAGSGDSEPHASANRFQLLRVLLARAPEIDQQQRGSDGDGGVGRIKGGEFVRAEEELQKIGHSSAQ